ncbi:hypothetical protein [Pseudomonas mosselii]|uniref:hypothetical protein n=1 Tax=Pseudomonas mosselii TaxID=78327 RepID=UPI001F4C10AD|nr:hypothetical protein [Pseudomonas mosselii]MCH7420693.1 hypothetical protein [Pseudomonas mosselii]
MQKTLKTLGLWVVATVAAVPLTKVAESSFDVSFFSPYIVRLWNWIQSGWSWLGSDVSLPAWLMLLLSLMSLLLVCFLGVLVYVRWFEKEEEHQGAPLTDEQERAFVVLGKAIQEGHKIGFDEVREYSGLSRIATQNALDHLYSVGLIRPVHNSFGFQYADLTPLGRDHYLDLEKLHGWGAMR